MFKFIQKSSIVALVVMMVTILTSCQSSNIAKIITPKGDEITLELAMTPKEQEDGLMFRTSLDENTGMLFFFPKMQLETFWMKNTLIPLDVVFIDDQNLIVDIQTMTPCPKDVQMCPTYPSKGPAKYALEINAGKAEKLGLKVGDALILNLPAHDQSQTK